MDSFEQESDLWPAVTVNFLDETPFIGPYLYPKPNTAYYTEYLASKVSARPAVSACILLLHSGLSLSPESHHYWISRIYDESPQLSSLHNVLQLSNGGGMEIFAQLWHHD